MQLKNLSLVLLAIIILAVVVSAAPANAAHWESVWVPDQSRGHWDSIPVTAPNGIIRYQARWIWDPPSGHYETVLVNDPVYFAPVPVYLPPFVYGTPYYRHNHYRRW